MVKHIARKEQLPPSRKIFMLAKDFMTLIFILYIYKEVVCICSKIILTTPLHPCLFLLTWSPFHLFTIRKTNLTFCVHKQAISPSQRNGTLFTTPRKCKLMRDFDDVYSSNPSPWNDRPKKFTMNSNFILLQHPHAYRYSHIAILYHYQCFSAAKYNFCFIIFADQDAT